MFVVANIKRKNEKNNIKTKKIIFFLKVALARNLHQLERGTRRQRNPKEIPSGEQQTNMIMDCVSQESPS